MNFNEQRFLGSQITEFVANVERNYSRFFEFCYRINELAQQIEREFNVEKDNGQQVLTAASFVRVLNGFNAVVLLVRLGLNTDAQVTLRGILEALFVLKLLCDDEHFVSEYILSDKASQLRLFNVASQSKNPNLAELRQHATPDVIAQLKEEVDRLNCRPLEIESVAHRAGLQHLYETDYRLLCLETHVSPRSLEKLLSFDPSGALAGFNAGPLTESLEFILMTAGQVLHVALVAATRLFGIDRTADLLELDSEWKKLVS